MVMALVSTLLFLLFVCSKIWRSFCDDGVTEATDANNNLYGEDRLNVTLNNIGDKYVKDVVDEVKTDIDQFVGDAPQFDDITMLCLAFKKRMQI